MTLETPQGYIAARCEDDLRQYGDSFRGVGYTKSESDQHHRYALMLDIVRERDELVHVLDLGCGLAHMLDHIQRDPALQHIRYSGLDISAAYIAQARRRHPEADLSLRDVLKNDDDLPEYDYVLLNSIFNWRGELPWPEMFEYWQQMLIVAFRHARRGLAFNVMSKIVEWERDDLFHLAFDAMASFAASRLSRHFVVRHDYPGWEYTTYVYREPNLGR
jgi:SAM-dependent methyltransferase